MVLFWILLHVQYIATGFGTYPTAFNEADISPATGNNSNSFKEVMTDLVKHIDLLCAE